MHTHSKFQYSDDEDSQLLQHVYLKRFRPETLNRDSFVAIIGKRRQGKTTLMENIALAMNFPRAVALCGSTGSKKYFSKFLLDSYIHEATVEKLRQIMNARDKQLKKTPTPQPPEVETLLFIDDIAFSRQFMFSEEMKNLAMNGRHQVFCPIISIQYLMEMSPSLRGNLDCIFVTRETSRINRRKLWENWGGCCSTLAHFEKILDACTQDYGCLVIDCQAKSTNYEDCFFHYRANPDLPPWTLGDEDFQRYHWQGVHRKKQKTSSNPWPSDMQSPTEVQSQEYPHAAGTAGTQQQEEIPEIKREEVQQPS